MPDKVKVVFFQRRPLPIHKSLEYIFEDVRSRMPDYIEPVKKVVSWYSKGVWPRIKIIREAYRSQGDVNHITGDIHFSALLLPREKTMLTVLDCRILSDSTGIRHLLLKYFWFTLPLRKCALVTVISQATREELIRFTGYPKEQIHVVPVAISPDFRYVPKPFGSRPVILQVGTTVNKNIERLIQALNGIDCQVNFIGALSEEALALLAANNISYSNATDISQQQLVQQYIQCDMISFASTYEGFGMPIIEANAVGRPVVTSNILSMPEVAGNAACLVNPLSIADIRRGVMEIIGNETYRNQLIENGLQNCKRFNPQVIADQYLALYLQLSGTKKDLQGDNV